MLSARAAEANGDFRTAIARGAEDLAVARARFESAVVAYESATHRNEGGDLTVDIRRIRLARRLLTLSARDRVAAADRARQAGDASAEHTALDEAISLAHRAYEIEPYEAVATERPQAMALWAEILGRAGRCHEALDLLAKPRLNWARDPSLSDVASWLSARVAGRDPATVPFISRALVERLSSAPPCAGAASGRVGSQIRDLERQLDEGKAVGFRLTAELLLASFPENADATDEIARRLRAHTDPLAPDVEAERAALLRILAPADDRLTTMIGDADVERRVAALRTAAHYGFERLHVLAPVEATFARSADRVHRVEFAESAMADPSPAVRALMINLLDDPDALVRRTAWRSLSGSLSAAVKGAVGYDPDAPDAERAAAVEKLRRQ